MFSKITKDTYLITKKNLDKKYFFIMEKNIFQKVAISEILKNLKIFEKMKIFEIFEKYENFQISKIVEKMNFLNFFFFFEDFQIFPNLKNVLNNKSTQSLPVLYYAYCMKFCRLQRKLLQFFLQLQTKTDVVHQCPCVF